MRELSVSAAALLALALAAAAGNNARAIMGGEDAATSDIGARATVFIEAPGYFCSGAIYGDSFVLTAAHCLVDFAGKPTAEAKDLKIIYGGNPLDPKAPIRRATRLVVHDHYIKQVQKFFSEAPGPREFADEPINQEDVAIIRVDGGHPEGTLGVELADIDNEYVFRGVPRLRLSPLLWMDVYGFGAIVEGHRPVLRKLRVNSVTPDYVRAGQEPVPGQFYFPRQIMVRPEDFNSGEGIRKTWGICHGDSGGPSFFVAASTAKTTPTTAIKLVKGRPLLIGLTSHGRLDAHMPNENCAQSLYMMRVDYYREWFLAQIKQMR